jgi:LacI family transcriptional regulator
LGARVTPSIDAFLYPDSMPSVHQKLTPSRYDIFRASVSRAPGARAKAAARETGAPAYGQVPGGGIGRSAAIPCSLTIDVLIGIPGENVVMATFPFILKGIRERAELEVKERPEVERIKIDVYYLAPGDFSPETGRQPRFRSVRSGDRRGTVLIYPFANSSVEVMARRTPTISVLEAYEGIGIDSIDTDDSSAISALVGRLHAQGHERIGFLSWHYPVPGHWVERRHRGYLAGLSAHGLEPDSAWAINVLPGGPRLKPAEAAESVAALVAGSGVTAWVCAADHQAYQLIRDLHARGVRVPQDCSITGFDGLDAPAGLPHATSMRAPHEHIGSSAITRMINRVMYPSSLPRKILVGAQLVPGASTAAPPQR